MSVRIQKSLLHWSTLSILHLVVTWYLRYAPQQGSMVLLGGLSDRSNLRETSATACLEPGLNLSRLALP